MAKWPKRVTPEELPDLLYRLRSGDLSAKKRLIEGHTRLVLTIANRFTARYPYLKDQIEETVLMNLVEKIERISSGSALTKGDNLGGLLNSTSVFKIKELIHNIFSERSKRRNTAINKEPTVFNTALSNLFVDSIMCSSEFTQNEKFIIGQRFQGFNDEEIAICMGVSKQRVALVRVKLRERLDKYL